MATTTFKSKFNKNDIVTVTYGNDKGKTGRFIEEAHHGNCDVYVKFYPNYPGYHIAREQWLRLATDNERAEFLASYREE